LGHSIAPEGLQDSAQGFNPGKLQFSGTPSQGTWSNYV
jgi:hypothetical protein